MKIISEKPLYQFEFWGPAKKTVELLLCSELRLIEEILKMDYPNGISETSLNDFFSFNDDWIAKVIGFKDFEELYNDRTK